MIVSFYTLGCKLNQSETEALASYFRNQGFFIVEIEEKADLFIINTCTVTSKSEQKARRMIRLIEKKNPEALIVVTGCYAELEKAQIEAICSQLIVVSQTEKASLFQFAKFIDKEHFPVLEPGLKKYAFKNAVKEPSPGSAVPAPFQFNVDSFQFHSRAFLKIQDGCDNSCAYCRVPLARGKSISLDPSVVINRAAALVNAGYNEIVITGVNITAYDFDHLNLSGLLERLKKAVKGTRLRLSSLEPDRLDDRLIDTLEDDMICPHFHIPLQSGSDSMLKLMNRKYSAAQASLAIKSLQSIKKNPYISGDIIIGFPGETAEDFACSSDLIRELGFSGLHIFPYSPRPGTAGFEMRPQVPQWIIKERINILREHVNILFSNYVSQFKGKEVNVLVTQTTKNREFWDVRGLSECYLKIQIPVIPREIQKGTIVKAKIIHPGPVSMAVFIES